MKNRLKVMLKKRKARDTVIPHSTDPYLKENVENINIILPATEEKKLASVSSIYYNSTVV